jgi:glycosyltransferase involved in cell wall biosynthesis
VIARCPEWFLVLAGDGPSRSWLLEELGREPLLHANVRWLGPRDDIPRLLKTANVLVLPSRWEGMPNVVLEAMAAGCPVVGTAVEGTEDLVVPGQTGWLVPLRYPEELGHALIEAAKSPERCQAYGQQGRLRAIRDFSLAKTVASYEHLWAGLLGLRLPTEQIKATDPRLSSERRQKPIP